MLHRHLITLLSFIVLFVSASFAHAAVNYPAPNGGGDNSGPQTYAILIGSQAPSNGVQNALRGDLDLANVASQLSWTPNVFKFEYNWLGPNTIASDIGGAASTIASRVKPGDSLIFYYSGHGVGGSGYGVQDYLNPVQNGLFQDNSLAALFSGSTFDSVKKFFIIDSCHAEGIWKNDTTDDRDLETLKNISFIGSSSEDGLSYTAPESNGTSYFTNAILSSLTPSATFGGLLASASASGGEVTGFTKDGEGTVAGKWQPVGHYSDDFDLNSSLGHPVPEPSTLVLFFTGMATPLLWRLRRKS